ncbi:alkene reductase [Rhodocaloribacter litoris]|uniref:alkene reductase n=1 Tax=Rhodocaloribacter litoris TaxID=2558931 RepID=UPI0014239B51|nr:alkene reductase [Rhodocaloribacter litoris]QXD14282.1 alkene reductase [Rhodocaloribacter litoris]
MKLLEPYPLGPLTLPNRIVMAPMTRNRARGTVPGPLNALYYRQRATAGLIITEASQVDPLGQGYPETPGIHSEAQVEGWRRVTGAVHEAGGRIFLQLWHVGRISHPSFHGGKLPVAPSAIRPAGKAFTYEGPKPFVTPRALATDELPGIVARFRRGAELAKAAGFDGVEIHGANGYLLDQFLQSGTNRRTDRYGGSVENRARLLLEVVEAVSDVWGTGRVGVRLSPGGRFNDMHDDDPAATFTYVARRLNAYGLAYLHVIREPEDVVLAFREGRRLHAPELLRPHFDGPLIAAGGYTPETAEQVLRDGHADLIAFGRLFIANPDLPRRIAEGAPLNEPDPATFYGGDEQGYTDYPALEETAACC